MNKNFARFAFQTFKNSSNPTINTSKFYNSNAVTKTNFISDTQVLISKLLAVPNAFRIMNLR